MFYRLVFDRGDSGFEYLIRASQNYGLWQLFSVKYPKRENWLLVHCIVSAESYVHFCTLYMYIKFCSIFKNHVTFVYLVILIHVLILTVLFPVLFLLNLTFVWSLLFRFYIINYTFIFDQLYQRSLTKADGSIINSKVIHLFIWFKLS